MTKEEMLNLKLYECNRKQCSGFRSCDTGHCHLTTNADFAVNPEQVLGYDYLIAEQLDEHWHNIREQYLGAIVNAGYYPEGAQTAAGIIGEMLDTDVQKNLEALRDSMQAWKGGIYMTTDVVFEKPIFTLLSRSYDRNGEDVRIYAEDLVKEDVGHCWIADDTGNCGRDNFCESIEIVYKNPQGVAVLHRKWGTTDDPDPEDWEDGPKLIWVELY